MPHNTPRPLSSLPVPSIPQKTNAAAEQAATQALVAYLRLEYGVYSLQCVLDATPVLSQFGPYTVTYLARSEAALARHAHAIAAVSRPARHATNLHTQLIVRSDPYGEGLVRQIVRQLPARYTGVVGSAEEVRRHHDVCVCNVHRHSCPGRGPTGMGLWP